MSMGSPMALQYPDLDCAVQGGTGKGVVILGVDDNLHDVVSVAVVDLYA